MEISRLLASAVVLALLFWVLPVRADDTLTWLVVAETPFNESDTTGIPISLSDISVAWFEKEITTLHHSTLHTTLLRAVKFISSSDCYCSPNFYKTAERSKTMIFSQEMDRSLPHRIIVQKARLADFSPFFDREGRVKLASLLNNADLHAVRLAGASLGPELDPLFARHRLWIEEVVRLDDSAYRRLMAGRLAWIIADALDASLSIARQPHPGAITTLAIAEQSNLQPSYVACSSGPIGRAAVVQIDRALQSVGDRAPWKAVYANMLDPDSRLELQRLETEAAKR